MSLGSAAGEVLKVCANSDPECGAAAARPIAPDGSAVPENPIQPATGISQDSMIILSQNTLSILAILNLHFDFSTYSFKCLLDGCSAFLPNWSAAIQHSVEHLPPITKNTMRYCPVPSCGKLLLIRPGAHGPASFMPTTESDVTETPNVQISPNVESDVTETPNVQISPNVQRSRLSVRKSFSQTSKKRFALSSSLDLDFVPPSSIDQNGSLVFKSSLDMDLELESFRPIDIGFEKVDGVYKCIYDGCFEEYQVRTKMIFHQMRKHWYRKKRITKCPGCEEYFHYRSVKKFESHIYSKHSKLGSKEFYNSVTPSENEFDETSEESGDEILIDHVDK
ncbi:hypothetical protein HK096_001868, partial [Nowakowskiella sp. JEL0078]